MPQQKLFEGRIDTGANGAEATIKLKPIKGGSMRKVARISIRVDASSGANVRISADLYHGPDGIVSQVHTANVMNAVDPTTTLPNVVGGDADTSKIIDEYVHWILRIKDSALTNAQWALVTVWDMGKPF